MCDQAEDWETSYESEVKCGGRCGWRVLLFPYLPKCLCKAEWRYNPYNLTTLRVFVLTSLCCLCVDFVLLQLWGKCMHLFRLSWSNVTTQHSVIQIKKKKKGKDKERTVCGTGHEEMRKTNVSLSCNLMHRWVFSGSSNGWYLHVTFYHDITSRAEQRDTERKVCEMSREAGQPLFWHAFLLACLVHCLTQW